MQQPERKPPPRKFVFRRSHKNKKSLSKEIVSARKMVNWVKLGHGVFTTIRKEDEDRMNAEENQKLQEAERRRREWQPPNVDSSDGDTDDELARDEDLSVFLTQSNNDGKKEVSFSRPETHLYTPASTLHPDHHDVADEHTDPISALGVISEQSGTATPSKSILSCSSPVVRRRRKKKSSEPPRPYTPIRSNINVENDDGSKANR